MQFILRNLRKTGSIGQNVNFYTKHVIANLPKFTVSGQNQTTKGLLKNLHTYKLWVYAALNWLLLFTKSSNWGTTINKTEMRNLKI